MDQAGSDLAAGLFLFLPAWPVIADEYLHRA